MIKRNEYLEKLNRFKDKQLIKVVMKKAKGTDIEILLKDSGLFK